MFAKRYLVPGTRAWKIMKWIDEGLSDAEIIKRLRCSEEQASMHVWHKAHDGKPSKPGNRYGWHADAARAARNQNILDMYEFGMKPKRISYELGVSYDIVRHVLKNAARARSVHRRHNERGKE